MKVVNRKKLPVVIDGMKISATVCKRVGKPGHKEMARIHQLKQNQEYYLKRQLEIDAKIDELKEERRQLSIKTADAETEIEQLQKRVDYITSQKDQSKMHQVLLLREQLRQEEARLTKKTKKTERVAQS